MKNYRRKAFTLIELLVVVAIIAVLMSILLPSLSQARLQAKTTLCQTHLRQIAMWGTIYYQEWNNVLPHNGGPGTSPSVTFYTELSADTWHNKYLQQMMTGNTKKQSGTVLHCPQATMMLQPVQTTSTSVTCHYSMNMWLGGVKSTGWYATPAVPRADLLSQDKFWFVDAKAATAAGSSSWIFTNFCDMLSASGNRRPWMWDYETIGHPDSYANVVYGDGHCERMSRAQFYGLSKVQWVQFTGSPNSR